MINCKTVLSRGAVLGFLFLGFQGCGSGTDVADPARGETQVRSVEQAVCAAWPPANPDPDFCTPACPCGDGQGDCDSQAQCLPGLTCVQNNGASFGYPSNYDMCVCPTFNEASPSSTFCSENCPCSAGEGGCSDDSQCEGSLVCTPNAGASYGLPGDYGVCEIPTSGCPTFNPSSPSTTFCSPSCPCDAGEGDCDTNAECATGLICIQNNGATYGLPANYDVCEAVAGCPPFQPSKPNPKFCTQACPCAAGEGDCDNNAECQSGLVCIQNNGATYGLPANYDACEAVAGCAPFQPSKPSTTFCTQACPCAAGEGDCDKDNQCQTGLTCVQNNGAMYGLPANYDVCE